MIRRIDTHCFRKGNIRSCPHSIFIENFKFPFRELEPICYCKQQQQQRKVLTLFFLLLLFCPLNENFVHSEGINGFIFGTFDISKKSGWVICHSAWLLAPQKTVIVCTLNVIFCSVFHTNKRTVNSNCLHTIHTISDDLIGISFPNVKLLFLYQAFCMKINDFYFLQKLSIMDCLSIIYSASLLVISF